MTGTLVHPETSLEILPPDTAIAMAKGTLTHDECYAATEGSHIPGYFTRAAKFSYTPFSYTKPGVKRIKPIASSMVELLGIFDTHFSQFDAAHDNLDVIDYTWAHYPVTEDIQERILHPTDLGPNSERVDEWTRHDLTHAIALRQKQAFRELLGRDDNLHTPGYILCLRVPFLADLEPTSTTERRHTVGPACRTYYEWACSDENKTGVVLDDIDNSNNTKRVQSTGRILCVDPEPYVRAQ